MATSTIYLVGNGSSTITPPATATWTVECWGAGQAGQDAGAFGGGYGGGYSRKNSYSATALTPISFSLGAPGTTTGQAGGDTWFGSNTTVIAPGGGSTTTAIGDFIAPGGPGGTTRSVNGVAGGGGAGGPNGYGQYGGNVGDGGLGGAGGGGNGGGGSPNLIPLSPNVGVTNGVIGSGGVLPQNGSGNYDNWYILGAAGLTVTIVGNGLVNGNPYIDLGFSGTCTSGFIQIVQGASNPITAGQIATYSQQLALTAGNLTNVTGFNIAFDAFSGTPSSGTYISTPTFQAIANPTSTLVGSSCSATTPAGTTFINQYPYIQTSTTAAVSFTLRIANPIAVINAAVNPTSNAGGAGSNGFAGTAGAGGATTSSPNGGAGGTGAGGGGGYGDGSANDGTGGAGGQDFDNGGGGGGGGGVGSVLANGGAGGTPGGGGGAGKTVAQGGWSVIKITFTSTQASTQTIILGTFPGTASLIVSDVLAASDAYLVTDSSGGAALSTLYLVGNGASTVTPRSTGIWIIECWGAGQASTSGGSPGAGGSWAQLDSYPVTANTPVSFNLGAQGTTSGQAGGDTWFGSSTTVIAPGGGSSTTAIGNATNAGGGIATSSTGHAGGGGAGGPNGVGNAGGSGNSGTAGAGGGGNGGGAIGSAESTTTGGAGGSGFAGTGGTGGASGNGAGGAGGLGAGGGGGGGTTGVGGIGGKDFDNGGGGGGGGASSAAGGVGGTPGGGAGGGNVVSAGGESVIKITITNNQPTVVESPEGTVLIAPTSNTIIASSMAGVPGTQNAYGINSAGQVTVNSSPATSTSFVSKLAKIDHSVFQYNGLNWLGPVTSTTSVGTTALTNPLPVILLSNNTVAAGAASGTVIGAISVTTGLANGSIGTGAFTWTLSLTAGSSTAAISGSNLVTNGALINGTYSGTIQAANSGIIGSPFTLPFTFTVGSESAQGTVVSGTAGTIFASSTPGTPGDQLQITITSGAQVAVNGVPAPGTAGVLQLIYIDSTCFQYNGSSYYGPIISSTSTGSTQLSSPLPVILLSNTVLSSGVTSGTVVGAISVTTGLYTGTIGTGAYTWSLSLSGTSASDFQIIGSNLETNASLANGSYGFNIVATNSSIVGSPFTMPFTVVVGSSAPAPAAAAGFNTLLLGGPGSSPTISNDLSGGTVASLYNGSLTGGGTIPSGGYSQTSGVITISQPAAGAFGSGLMTSANSNCALQRCPVSTYGVTTNTGNGICFNQGYFQVDLMTNYSGDNVAFWMNYVNFGSPTDNLEFDIVEFFSGVVESSALQWSSPHQNVPLQGLATLADGAGCLSSSTSGSLVNTTPGVWNTFGLLWTGSVLQVYINGQASGTPLNLNASVAFGENGVNIGNNVPSSFWDMANQKMYLQFGIYSSSNPGQFRNLQVWG